MSYPGRSGSLLQEEPPSPGGGGKGAQKSAEGMVAAPPRCEGPKRQEKTAAVSGHSHGFLPDRSAHQAVQAARRHVEERHRWVVDIGLEKLFDRVNHDILVARLCRWFYC